MYYSINIQDRSILDLCIPRLCVEPIVENAVVHGLENKSEKGCVTVNVIRKEESIFFEIIDDGLGLDIEKIQQKGPLDDREEHNKIGLNNAHRRIQLIYGEQYGIHVQSRLGHGTKVIIHIPADNGGEDIVQGFSRG